MSVKVLIVDDHKITREGLAFLISQRGDCKVVGEAATGKEAIDLAAQLLPEVIIMDIKLPDIDGIEATRKILEKNGAIKVLGLSMYHEKHYIQELFKAGALGYLSKDCDFDELVEAIQAVLDGKTYIAKELRHVAIEDYISQWSKGGATGKADLTYREVRVLELLASGMSTKEIAHTLGKSTKTVEACRRSIMEKLELFSVAELTKYALRLGLTSP